MPRLESMVTGWLVAGAVLGVGSSLTWADALAAAVAAAAVSAIVPSRRGARALLLLALAAAAAAHGAAARDRALQPPLAAWFDHAAGAAERLAAPVTIDGTIAADAALVGDSVRLIVDVDRVRDAAGWRRAPGRVQLHVGGALAAAHVRDWTAGRRAVMPVLLRRPQELFNFGGPSPFWQQLRRPFALAGSVKSAALVAVERGRWWAELASRARWRARDAAARFIAPRDPQAAAIVVAILIGDRAGLDEDLVHRFQIAGTYHVIAISGGNVALLTALCFIVLRAVVRAPRVVAVLTLIVTLAYGLIVGGDPSVARAVIAAAIYLTAALAGLVPAPLATLRTVAAVLALIDPLILVDVGAWLSFGATFGILVLAGPILRRVPWETMPDWLRAALRPVGVLLAATIAAELILLPIGAAVFGRVTAAGLFLNVIAIPAMSVVQIAGLVVVMAGPAIPTVGAGLAWVTAQAAHAMIWSTALVDAWPWLSWRVPTVSIGWIAGYYVAAGSIWWLRGRQLPQRVILGAAAVALGVIAFAPATEWSQPIAGRLRVSMIDVGQGDSTLVQLPNGDALLIDAGGVPGSFDIGSRVVTPAVWALGVRRLSWFALTHPDLDHIGGAVSVAEDLTPHEIWEGVPVPRDPDLRRIRDFAMERGIAWRTVRRGARMAIGPACVIEIVHPPDPDWERQKSRNDDSIVVRIHYGLVDLLLTGDAGVEFEARPPDDWSSSGIRILKAGHHGSKTSTSDRLVQAMRPQIALISVGRGNVFGQPSPEVIDRLTRAGARIFRTDQDGAVSVETDGRTVRVLTALGRSWTLAVVGPA